MSGLRQEFMDAAKAAQARFGNATHCQNIAKIWQGIADKAVSDGFTSITVRGKYGVKDVIYDVTSSGCLGHASNLSPFWANIQKAWNSQD